MANSTKTHIGFLFSHTIGGGWGVEEPQEGFQPVQIIRGADFPAANMRHLETAPLRFESRGKVASRQLRVNDIVLETSGGTKDRPTGRTVLITETLLAQATVPVIPASFCRLLRVDPAKADARFVYYLIQDLYNSGGTWEFQNQSTGLSNFQFELFRSRFQVSLPTLVQQRAAVDVLTALDDKIAANARLASTADHLALALVGWPQIEAPLRDVVAHRRAATDPASLVTNRVAHFSLPAFDLGRTAEIVSPDVIKSSKFVLSRPSVLLSKLNPRFPRVWDVPTVPEVPALASTEFLVLEPRFSSSTVLWAILAQPAFGAALEGKVAGTSGSHQRVRPEDVLSIAVPDPRRMGDDLKDSVTSLGRRAIQARSESGRLGSIRDALLPALMSGRLRVRDAERLARIGGS